MKDKKTIRAAAIQLETDLGNVDHNLEISEQQANLAAAQGAQWIVLPEYFSTGIAYEPELAQLAAPLDGAPTQLLRDIASRHGVIVGGSMLLQDTDGHVRNTFVLVGRDGTILGRHDKDLPTMWENAVHTGGNDPGVIPAADVTAGIALCWELLRTQTVARLIGKVDVVLSGSAWWSLPKWPLLAGAESRNKTRARNAPAIFARYVGAPVVHATLAGTFQCPLPMTPLTYRGCHEGGAQVCNANGEVLAFRDQAEGSGAALADITLHRTEPLPTPQRFWLQSRGILPATAWGYQGRHGRRMYASSHASRPPGPERLTSAANKFLNDDLSGDMQNQAQFH